MRVALASACAAFVVALVAGFALGGEKPLPLPADRAARIAAHDPEIHAQAGGATSHRVERVDDSLARVTFLHDGKVVATAGVRRDGRVVQPEAGATHYGADISRSALAFVVLAALFLAAALRRPLRTVATLDALALTAFAVPALLIDRGYVAAGQGSAAVLLAYSAARAATIVVRGAPARSGRPLLEAVRAPRLPLLAAGSLALVTAVMAVCSTGAVDVATATMEGATRLTHGVLPYGQLSGDAIHGDTYGLPLYASYVPAAALWPVTSGWDEVTGALVVAALCALASAWALARAMGGEPATALVIALAFPPALLAVTSGTNDVVVAAALAWALAWSARPGRSTGLLVFAGLAKLAPLALLPAWVARERGRTRLLAIAVTAALVAALLVALVALGGSDGPADMARAVTFQLERRSLNSLYESVGIGAVQPLVLALAVALAVGGATLFALDDRAARDPRRLAALCAAVLATLQLAAHYWAPLYLLWLLPPAAIMLLGERGGEPVPAPAPPRLVRYSKATKDRPSTGEPAVV